MFSKLNSQHNLRDFIVFVVATTFLDMFDEHIVGFQQVFADKVEHVGVLRSFLGFRLEFAQNSIDLRQRTLAEGDTGNSAIERTIADAQRQIGE